MAILEVVLVMEEEEEDMVVEDLDMATRVGATEVVMTTMEEVIPERQTYFWTGPVFKMGTVTIHILPTIKVFDQN